jgi:hypothetical protein
MMVLFGTRVSNIVFNVVIARVKVDIRGSNQFNSYFFKWGGGLLLGAYTSMH